MSKINTYGYTDLCKEDCEFLIPIEKSFEGNAGSMFSPEPYTHRYTGYICCKYKSELDLIWGLGSFASPILGVSPFMHIQCLKEVENNNPAKNLTLRNNKFILNKIEGKDNG